MGQPALKNDFKADLQYSMDDELFNNFYRKEFPNIKEIRFEGSLNKQFKAIDKTLIFESGYEITVDEKKRRVDYGDILLELLSNKESGRKGWLYTAQCDYIAYAVVPTKIIYFLPTTLLKMVWWENNKIWQEKYSLKEAINKGYTTVNIPIPTNELLDAIRSKIINKADKEE